MNIFRIIKQLGITKLSVQLSLYLMTILDWYVKEGYIEFNKFIVDSIKNHIDYVTVGPGGDNTSPTVELEIQIPILLALKLWWKAWKTKTSISSIVNVALSFSISCIMEQDQAQEDFGFEVGLDE